MEAMTECEFVCPHCWQPLHILVARPDLPARLVEDCQVCCRPLRLEVRIEGKEAWAEAFPEVD